MKKDEKDLNNIEPEFDLTDTDEREESSVLVNKTKNLIEESEKQIKSDEDYLSESEPEFDLPAEETAESARKKLNQNIKDGKKLTKSTEKQLKKDEKALNNIEPEFDLTGAKPADAETAEKTTAPTTSQGKTTKPTKIDDFHSYCNRQYNQQSNPAEYHKCVESLFEVCNNYGITCNYGKQIVSCYCTPDLISRLDKFIDDCRNNNGTPKITAPLGFEPLISGGISKFQIGDYADAKCTFKNETDLNNFVKLDTNEYDWYEDENVAFMRGYPNKENLIYINVTNLF